MAISGDHPPNTAVSTLDSRPLPVGPPSPVTSLQTQQLRGSSPPSPATTRPLPQSPPASQMDSDCIKVDLETESIEDVDMEDNEVDSIDLEGENDASDKNAAAKRKRRETSIV